MKRFRNVKFRTKLILLSVAVMGMCMLASGLLFYEYARRNVVKNYISSSETMVSQTSLYISDKFRAMEQTVSAMGNNLSFNVPMKAFLENPEVSYDAVLAGKISDMVSELRMQDELISSVYIYTKKGVFDDYTLSKRPEVSYEDTPMYRYYVYHPSAVRAWFPAMGNLLYNDVETVIPIVFRQRIGKQDIHYIINISQRRLLDYLRKFYAAYDDVWIVDADGKNVVNFVPEAEVVLEMFQDTELHEREAVCRQIRVGKEKYLATYAVMQGSGWRIYALTSESTLVAAVQNVRGFVALIMVLTFGICIMASSYLANRVTMPLEQLAVAMEGTVEKKFRTNFDYPYYDEVGSLGRSFNHMIEEIEELVSDLNIHIEALKQEKEIVRQVQSQKRKAELLALQAQINPHFLYNTLNAITWEASEQGADKIAHLSNALGKYFRISLSRGREVITVREELEHVKSYLEIQQIRYKDKLSYEFAVEEELYAFPMLKLLLQPLAENALYHGLKPREHGGHMVIRGRQEQDEAGGRRLVFVVEDDGVGIESQYLRLLNNRLSAGIVDNSTGYGIYNVNERVRLYYGEAYGLRLNSIRNMGTQSILTIGIKE